MRLLFFELTIALVFLFLSVGICWMAWALPIGLAPTFSVSSGAFAFLLGVILLLLSVWWTLDLQPSAEGRSCLLKGSHCGK